MSRSRSPQFSFLTGDVPSSNEDKLLRDLEYIEISETNQLQQPRFLKAEKSLAVVKDIIKSSDNDPQKFFRAVKEISIIIQANVPIIKELGLEDDGSTIGESIVDRGIPASIDDPKKV